MASKKAAIGEATKEYRRDLYAIALYRHVERVGDAARTAKRLRRVRDVFANDPIEKRTSFPLRDRIVEAIELLGGDGERDVSDDAMNELHELSHAIPVAAGHRHVTHYWEQETTTDDDRWSFLVAAIAHVDAIRETPAPTFAAIVKHDDARIAALRGA